MNHPMNHPMNHLMNHPMYHHPTCPSHSNSHPWNSLVTGGEMAQSYLHATHKKNGELFRGKDEMTNKRKAIRAFCDAVGTARCQPDIDALWDAATQWAKDMREDAEGGEGTFGTLNTKMSNTKSITHHLGIPDDKRHDGFEQVYGIVQNLNKADKEWQTLSLGELRQLLKTKSGDIFTITTLRNWVSAQLDDPPESDVDRFRVMVLACLTFGHRQQDFIDVGYGKANAPTSGVKEGCYYDPTTRLLHTHGKTDKIDKKTKKLHLRTVTMPPLAVRAIATYHTDTTHTMLLPFTVSDTGSHIRTQIIGRVFEQNGWPTKHINVTLLRCLYETHIRDIEKLPDDEIEQRMKEIGHSPKTAERHYRKYGGIQGLLLSQTAQ